MKHKLTVATFNIQNNSLNKSSDLETISGNIIKFIQTNTIDVLGTQELTRSYLDQLYGIIPDEYKIIGDYRYGNGSFVKLIKYLDRFNETNSIITNHKIVESRTRRLPWFPTTVRAFNEGLRKYKSITPRVVTELMIEVSNQKIRILNTHLDVGTGHVKKKQIRRILNLIRKSNDPVILMGDFNMNVNHPLFIEFASELLLLGLKRVDINSRTLKRSKNDLSIDHIFIPMDFNVLSIQVVHDKLLEDVSDHYPIIVKLEF